MDSESIQSFDSREMLICYDKMRLWVFDHFKEGLGMPTPGQGGADDHNALDRIRHAASMARRSRLGEGWVARGERRSRWLIGEFLRSGGASL